MSEVTKTSLEWFNQNPYNGLQSDNVEGWVTAWGGKKDLYKFNTEKITETEFRKRMKESNTPVPEDTVETAGKK